MKTKYDKECTLSETHEDLLQRTRREVQIVKRRFSDLVAKVRQKIKDLDDGLVKLVAHLSCMSVLTEDDEMQVLRATSVDSIFIILRSYWSFLDYENLEDIAVNVCYDDTEHEWKEYGDAVKIFCERRISEFPNDSLHNGVDHQGMEKLYIWLDLTDPSLNRIKHLKEVIANILGRKASKLILENIARGSVCVTFLIATSLGEALFEKGSLTDQQKDAFRREHAISLKFKSTLIMFHQQQQKGIYNHTLF